MAKYSITPSIADMVKKAEAFIKSNTILATGGATQSTPIGAVKDDKGTTNIEFAITASGATFASAYYGSQCILSNIEFGIFKYAQVLTLLESSLKALEAKLAKDYATPAE